MVPCTPEELMNTLLGVTNCFRCSNLDCKLFYVYGHEVEGYYKLETTGELRRDFQRGPRIIDETFVICSARPAYLSPVYYATFSIQGIQR